MASPSEDWVTLARLVKTQGRRGELAADLLTDIPNRFDGLRQVWLFHPSGRRQEFHLAQHWFHQGRVVLGFEEIADMTAAEAWIGAEVQVPRRERASAPAGAYFLADLEGCRVFDRGRAIGTVASVESVAGAAPLLHVTDPQDRDLLIPFVEAYLESVSIADHRIAMNLPDGLLDININAPLAPGA